MRLLHVVPTYLPATRYGGPIYSVHGLCKALAARGHEVHVFTTNVDGSGDSDVPLAKPVPRNGVNVWYFPSHRLRRLYWSPPMAKALQKLMPGFDLVHLHSIFLWPTWMAARLARRFNVPYILAPRGMLVKDLIQRKSSWLKTAWIVLIERHNIEHASALHLTSEAEAQECKAFGFRLPSLCVIPNGVDLVTGQTPPTEVSAEIQGVVKQQPLLLFLSRINWKKGLDRLLKAMVHLPDVYLAIAGNDEENYKTILIALARELEVMERIGFLGPVQGADKECLLGSATLLVLPSYSENFGNVILEAMAQRCPVVVTPEVGLAELVREAGAGQVIEGEPEQLADGIQRLLQNPRRRQQMGEAGQRVAQERFTWAGVAAQMEQLYGQCIKSRRAANSLINVG